MARRGLGVIQYCNRDGGSGFIANPALPWLSTFDITQLSPVYDQDMGWLRDSKPGSFSFYPHFQTPGDLPAPYDTSCAGMGGLGDLILRRADVVAALPSITGAARSGCDEPANPCSGELSEWVKTNPWLAAGIAAAGAFLLFGGNR